MSQPNWIGAMLFPWRRHMFFWVRVVAGTTVALIVLLTVRKYNFGINPYIQNENARHRGTKMIAGEEPSSEQDIGNTRSPIPHKIWQIMLPKEPSNNKPIDSETLLDTVSWIAMNPDYA